MLKEHGNKRQIKIEQKFWIINRFERFKKARVQVDLKLQNKACKLESWGGGQTHDVSIYHI